MQLVYIRDVNNAPTLSDPQASYSKPAICGPSSLLPVCHCGQFFSYEFSDSRVGIVGVQMDDVDIGELCIYPQTQCANMDVLASALHGAVSLNSRTGINFYLESRGSTGFTAFMSQANTAVKTIYYQVELAEDLSTSSVRYFNTQTAGNSEYVSVVASDQGASGASGVAKTASLQITVTIVAVNNPPVITINVIEYEVSARNSSLFKPVPGEMRVATENLLTLGY